MQLVAHTRLNRRVARARRGRAIPVARHDEVRAEGPGFLRISSPTRLSDGDYLFWGTDTSQIFTFSTDIPHPSRRLHPTWAYTITDGGDGVGVVNLRFRVDGLFVSERASDFALLFDDDGAFSDARVTGRATFDPGLKAVEFQGVELGPERFFGLAVRSP